MQYRAPSSQPRVGVTLVELLVVIAIVGVLTSLLIPVVQVARDTARRMSCQNNMKQLALSLHGFHDRFRTLPPGHRSTTHPDRMPYSGWTFSVLPYVEQPQLYSQAKQYYISNNSPFRPPHIGLDQVVPVFMCPGDGRVQTPQVSEESGLQIALTSYPGVAGEAALDQRNGMLFQDSRQSLNSATDGTSNTLLLGERPPSANFQFGWWYACVGQRLTGSADLVLGVREPNAMPIVSGSLCGPGRYPFQPSRFDDQCGMFHFWSPHLSGANFALADGSVRMISYSANPIMPSLATRSGGEVTDVL